MFQKISLANRIFLYSLFITGFVIISISISAFLIFNGMLRDNISESDRELITYLARDIENKLKDIEAFSDYVYLHSGIETFLRMESTDENQLYFLKQDIDEDIGRYVNTGTGFSVLSLSILGNNNSQYLYGYDAAFTDNNQYLSNRWKTAFDMSGQDYLWIGLYDRADRLNRKGDYVVALVRYLKSIRDREELGVMLLELSPGDLLKDWDVGRNRDSSVFVLDGAGNILFPPEKEFLGKSFSRMELDADLSRYHHKTQYTMDRYGWRVIVLKSLDDQVAQNKKMLYLTMFFLFLAILFYIVVFLNAINRITDPLKKLTETMHLIREGDRTARYLYESEDEVGYLAKSFNIMLDRIDDLNERNLLEEREKQEAEYKALQARMNPHFLYNTLNSIRWMAIIQGADNIVDSLEILGRLLRKSMSFKGAFVPLEEEILMLEDYVSLQKIRYKNKFDYVCDIPQSLYAYNSLKFLLQPIVENAIFHGIEPREGKGIIVVNGRKEGDDMLLTVRDDGIGFDARVFNPLFDYSDRREGNRIGLGNVHRRIVRRFGKSYGITFDSQPGEFTEITIKIPLISCADSEKDCEK